MRRKRYSVAIRQSVGKPRTERCKVPSGFRRRGPTTAVRESFFVSFLGELGVAADPAFATGFLFFVVTIALALPGAAIVAVEALRRR